MKKIGLVIKLTQEDDMLLKRHQLNLEELGIKKTKSELASDLFCAGLHSEIMKS